MVAVSKAVSIKIDIGLGLDDEGLFWFTTLSALDLDSL